MCLFTRLLFEICNSHFGAMSFSGKEDHCFCEHVDKYEDSVYSYQKHDLCSFYASLHNTTKMRKYIYTNGKAIII